MAAEQLAFETRPESVVLLPVVSPSSDRHAVVQGLQAHETFGIAGDLQSDERIRPAR